MNQRKQESVERLKEIERSSARSQWASLAWTAMAGVFVIVHSAAVAQGEGTFHNVMLVLWSIVLALWIEVFYGQRSNVRRARQAIREWDQLP